MSYNITKILYSIVIFLLLSLSIKAQDLIITQEGEEIECKVIEIDPPKIKYKLKNQPEGPLRNLDVSSVFMIKYEDGTKELFNKQKKGKSNLKKSLEMAKSYQPISIGLSPTFAISGGILYGMMVNVGYEFKSLPLKLMLDGTIVTPRLGAIRYAGLYTCNLNLHYIFKLAKGNIEVFPEAGIGLFYGGHIRTLAPVINVGVGVDFRISDLFSIYLHPRYQFGISSNSRGAFLLNLGVRFRFGAKKNK